MKKKNKNWNIGKMLLNNNFGQINSKRLNKLSIIIKFRNLIKNKYDIKYDIKYYIVSLCFFIFIFFYILNIFIDY